MSHPPIPRIIYIVTAAAILTTACARSSGKPAFTPTESSLCITSEGTVTAATIETYDKNNDRYTAGELRTYTEEILEAFNSTFGRSAAGTQTDTPPAAVTECTLSDGTAKLLITFKDAASYQEFMSQYPDEESEIQIKNISVTDMSSASADPDFSQTTFRSPSSDGKTASAEDLKKKTKLTVARIEGPALIETDASIQYISDGVTVTGDRRARTPDDGVSYIIFK